MANNDRKWGVTTTAALADRALFPKLSAGAYANHAAISPPSAPVAAAVQAWMEDWQARGSLAYGSWAEQRDLLRSQLAGLIGAAASDIAFVSNTMHGVNAIASGLPWQRGDRVIVIEGEYPTNVVPWLRAADVFGLDVVSINVSSFAGEEIDWRPLEEALERTPRVLAVSAVQFQSGVRMPLAEISERCRAVGTQVFVDGVQACGGQPIDVKSEGIDYLACGSHKWLMGIEGAGFLYVRPDRMGQLRPTLTGAMSYLDAFDLLNAGPDQLRYDRPSRRDVRVFEGGMLGGTALVALGASVGLIQQLGVSAVANHVQRYHDALEPELEARGFVSLRHSDRERRSGILSFTPPSNVFTPTLCSSLAEQGVVCSSPDGLLRFSPHWPNALTEIPLIADALDVALASLAR